MLTVLRRKSKANSGKELTLGRSFIVAFTTKSSTNQLSASSLPPLSTFEIQT